MRKEVLKYKNYEINLTENKSKEYFKFDYY